MTNVSRILGTLLVCAVLQTALAQSPQQQAEDEAIRRAEKSILLRKTLESAESLQKERDLNAAAAAAIDAADHELHELHRLGKGIRGHARPQPVGSTPTMLPRFAPMTIPTSRSSGTES